MPEVFLVVSSDGNDWCGLGHCCSGCVGSLAGTELRGSGERGQVFVVEQRTFGALISGERRLGLDGGSWLDTSLLIQEMQRLLLGPSLLRRDLWQIGGTAPAAVLIGEFDCNPMLSDMRKTTKTQEICEK